MSPADANEVINVLERIKTWEPALKISLARQILESLESSASRPAPGPRGRPASELIGIGAGDGPPPDDERVKQWIDEYRMEKYG